MQGLGQDSMPVGAEAACRESTMGAVQQDLHMMREELSGMEVDLQSLIDHLQGAQPQVSELNRETPPPSGPGIVPAMCQMGAENIGQARRIREQIRQVAYLMSAS